MLKKGLLTTISVLSMSSSANAGYLVQNAAISNLYNVSGNQSGLFALTVTGGTGPCSGGVNILFPVSSAPDADAHRRAFALAMMAFATGKRVAIYNYSNDDCTGASYIALSE